MTLFKYFFSLWIELWIMCFLFLSIKNGCDKSLMVWTKMKLTKKKNFTFILKKIFITNRVTNEKFSTWLMLGNLRKDDEIEYSIGYIDNLKIFSSLISEMKLNFKKFRSSYKALINFSFILQDKNLLPNQQRLLILFSPLVPIK